MFVQVNMYDRPSSTELANPQSVTYLTNFEANTIVLVNYSENEKFP